MALSTIKQTIHYLKLYHINEETPDVAPFEDIVKNYYAKLKKNPTDLCTRNKK